MTEKSTKCAQTAQIESSLLKQETKEQNEMAHTGPEACVSLGSDSEDMISQDTIRELWAMSFKTDRYQC